MTLRRATGGSVAVVVVAGGTALAMTVLGMTPRPAISTNPAAGAAYVRVNQVGFASGTPPVQLGAVGDGPSARSNLSGLGLPLDYTVLTLVAFADQAA
jgi:hypothetical protein